MGTVPVFKNNKVVAWSKIDDQDLPKISKHKWNLLKDGRVFRSEWIRGCSQRIYLARQVLGMIHGDDRNVHHKDGDKLNNASSNLEILERSDHAAKHFAQRSKEEHPRAKLSIVQVKAIRVKWESGKSSLRNLAKEYGVCYGNIGMIVRNETWSGVAQ